MTDSRYRRPWEWPDCPDCGHEVFVGRSTVNVDADEDYLCHFCGALFDAPAFVPP